MASWAIWAFAAAVASAQDHPRAEVFTGFTYARANSASNVPAFSANGGGGQVFANFNKWVGFGMDLGAFHNGNIGGAHLDSTFTTFLFGPRISLRYSRIRPYFNVLFGGVHASTSTALAAVPTAGPYSGDITGLPPVTPGQPVTLRASASQTAFAMTTGGGLDIKISRHVSFRPIGLDYLMTRLQNLRSAEDNNQHNIRYTTGLNFTFGGEAPTPPPPPPPPPMHSCWNGSSLPMGTPCPLRNMNVQSPAAVELCAGTSLKITAPGTPPEGATYQWRIDGEPVSKEATIEFGTSGREPGAHKIAVTMSAPEYNDAVIERTVNIAAYRPPTGSLEASPREIWAGEKATLSANFTPGHCGGNLGVPAFSASEGSVSGNQFDSADVRFDPAATTEQRKTITLLAKVSDGNGEAQAQTALVVKKAAPVLAKRFPDIVFPNGNARVNNCGKRVLLEELKTATDADPTGKVVLVGHVSEKEAGKKDLDQQRALNAAAVLSAGQGVCSSFPASQVLVGTTGATDNGVDYQSKFCGSTNERPASIVKEGESDAKYRRVEVWFVPTGGMLPASVKEPKDAAALAVSGLGCPR
jgi:hypothetical protein